MANDIVAAPVPIVVSGTTFEFCPLQDREFSQLLSFVRLTFPEAAEFDDEYLAYLQIPSGAAYLLYLSVLRSQVGTYAGALEFVDSDDETALDIFNAWVKLNFDDVEYPKVEITPDVKPFSKDQIYLELAKLYRWGPEIVSRLTPYQQYIYCTGYAKRSDGTPEPQTKTFETMDEYNAWRAKFNKVKQ